MEKIFEHNIHSYQSWAVGQQPSQVTSSQFSTVLSAVASVQFSHKIAHTKTMILQTTNQTPLVKPKTLVFQAAFH